METTPIEPLFVRYRDTGDVAALAAVFDRTAAELLRVARHLIGTESDAEDLVQLTFLTVLERARQFDERRPLVPWLIGILDKHARNARRRRARVPEPDRLAAEPAADPRVVAAARETLEAVTTQARRLPAPYREVVADHLNGVDAAEIARRSGRSLATVRVQIHRGVKRLRALLPRGLVGVGAVAAGAPRGLAAVRAEVLSAASPPALAVGGLSVGATVGGFLVNKWIASLVLLACVVGLAVVTQDSPVERAARDGQVRAQAAGPAAAAAIVAEVPARDPAAAGESVDLVVAAGVAERQNGIVRDLALQPIAGAQVIGVRYGAPPGDEPRFRTVSAADGRFVPPPASDGLILIATHPGFARGRAASHSDTPADTTEIRLAPRIALSGRITDGEGRGVAGARVEVSDALASLLGPWAATVSDAGTYRAEVGTDQSVTLIGRWPDGAIGCIESVSRPLGSAPTCDLVLRRGVELAIAVSGSGAPLADALVVLLAGKHPGVFASRLVDHAVSRVARTDAAGRVRLMGIPCLEAAIYAAAPGFAPARVDLEITQGDGRLERSIELLPGASLSGRVLRADGAPAARARVTLTGGQRSQEFAYRSADEFDDVARLDDGALGGAFRTSVRTDADGRFELRDAPLCRAARLRAEHSQDGEPTATAWSMPFTMEPGASLAGIEVRMPRRVRVHGVVRTVDGRPLPEHTAVLRPPTGPGATPDADGRFAATVDVTGDELILLGCATGYVTQPRIVTVPADGDVEVDFALDPGERLAVEVIDAAGQPVPQARVWVTCVGGVPQRALHNSTTSAGATMYLGGDADAAGCIEVPGLQRARYLVWVQKDGYRDVRVEHELPVDRPVQITLAQAGGAPAEPPPAFVRGRVIDAANGQPVRGFTVGAMRSGDGRMLIECSARGVMDDRFELRVWAGEQRVVVRAEGFAPSLSDVCAVRAGETVEGVVVALRRGSIAHVAFVDALGRPVPGLRAVVRPVGGGQHGTSLAMAASVIADADGIARFSDLAPGRYAVLADHESLAAPLDATLHVTPEGGRDPVTIQCVAGGRAVVRVARLTFGDGRIDYDVRAVADDRIVAAVVDGAWLRAQEYCLPVGDYRVEPRIDDVPQAAEFFRVGEGESTGVEVRLTH